MSAESRRSSNAHRPIPLEYSGGDLPSDKRRQIDAHANDFGGWPQISAALGLGAFGILLGWLFFGSSGFACAASCFGAVGFAVGLFIPLPDGADGWRRWVFGFVCGAATAAISWCILPWNVDATLSALAFRAGLFWADHTNWLSFSRRTIDDRH